MRKAPRPKGNAEGASVRGVAGVADHQRFVSEVEQAPRHQQHGLNVAAAFPVGEQESGHDREIRVPFACGNATKRSLDFESASIEGSKTGLNRF
jgi:hypothetical protein